MTSIQTFAAAALAFVVAIVMIAIGTKITSDIGVQINDTHARQVTNYGLDALKVLAQWLPLVAIVIVAVVIIALLLRGFQVREE
jgi:hypothetical protein